MHMLTFRACRGRRDGIESPQEQIAQLRDDDVNTRRVLRSDCVASK